MPSWKCLPFIATCIFSCAPMNSRRVNVHLLAHNRGEKVGLALPVAVHNTPTVILTRIPQPYI